MMTDLLFKVGLSNACFALVLALIALTVAVTTKRAHLVHLLWVLVLVKLVTPPLFSIPVAIDHSLETDRLVAIGEANTAQQVESSQGNEKILTASITSTASDAGSDEAFSSSAILNALSDTATTSAFALSYGKQWLPPIWLLGTAIVLVCSLVRVRRFGRLLGELSEDAPQRLQEMAGKIAGRLKLNAMPIISTTAARISPMVWWTGGRVRVVIPQSLIDEMDDEQLQWIVAHELAHVRRRDYLVRWLEWFACVCFWWNPVVWWAMRNLRAAEEICCDSLVLSSLHPKPRTYANSILTAVESLARPAIRPPAMASEINSGGFLERRFRMIVSKNSHRRASRLLQACVLICAVVVLPLGVAWAQDAEKDGNQPSIEQRLESIGKRLKGAVERGDMTEEEAWKKWAEIKENMIAPQLKASVKSGKMTGEKAREIWKGIEKTEIAAKLKSAVEKGKISAEDARAKFAELTGEGKEKAPGIEGVGKFLEAIGKKIQAAVEAGDITEEDGWKKWNEVKTKVIKGAVKAGKITEDEGWILWKEIEKHERDMKQEDVDGDVEVRGERIKAVGDFLGAIAKKIEAAAKAGKITGEEAAAKWQAAKTEVIKGAVKADKLTEKEARILWATVEKHEVIYKRLGAAVAAGKMTEEEAKAKFVELTDEGAKSTAKEAKARAIAEEIQKAVKAGKISEEDAKKKMVGLRLRMAVESGSMTAEEARAKFAEIFGEAGAEKSGREARAAKARAIAEEIRKAVEAGKISEEDAKKKMVGLRLHMAVESGSMTAEEARAKWNEIFGDKE